MSTFPLRYLLPALLLCGPLACAHALPDPAERPIVARTIHEDQVCEEIPRPYPLNGVHELMETGALQALLSSISEPGTVDEDGETVPPFADVAVNYSASGDPRYLAVYETNMSRESAYALARTVRDGIGSLGPLIEPLPVILHLEAGPEPVLGFRRSVRCMPHLAHQDDGTIILPGSVRVTGLFLSNDPLRASVTLGISSDGELLGAQPHESTAPELLPRIESLIDSLRYEPGLLNGEPVQGTLTQVFIFPPAPDSTGR